MSPSKSHRRDPLWVRILLIGLTLVLFGLLLAAPLLLVFQQALAKGWELYLAAVTQDEALKAVQLTFFVVLWVVPLNTLFGVAAAWLVTRFPFRGKTFLTALIDLPFAVSPVIAGLVFVLLFGSRTPLGAWLGDAGIKIVFSTPGIILATVFVTFPFVARELIPLMQSLGREDEEAALTLGARGWQTFFRVTLPNIKWGLVYGIILCNARAIGEFGAVSVISGHVRGETNTVPLHVEILYGEYDYTAAFAVSTLLVFVGFITILVKVAIEGRQRKIHEH